MATITAQSVIDKAQTILQDTTGVRWPSAELLGWLNDGQREVTLYKPNAAVANAAVRLVSGTKQTLPATAIQLLDVVRNLGTDGNAPGRAIRLVQREIMDAQTPNWHADAPSAEVVHYMFSPVDPRTFYVYPPQPVTGTGYVELVYGASPSNAVLGGNISIDDIYQNVLVDYIMYRAYSKDAEYAADQGRAAQHQNAYMSALTGKTQAELVVNPNSTSTSNPNVTPNSR